MSATPDSTPDTGPPAANATPAVANASSAEHEKDPEEVIMEIYDIILRLEAKVERILEAGKSQKGGRFTRKGGKRH
jgi:hypothetical protein